MQGFDIVANGDADLERQRLFQQRYQCIGNPKLAKLQQVHSLGTGQLYQRGRVFLTLFKRRSSLGIKAQIGLCKQQGNYFI